MIDRLSSVIGYEFKDHKIINNALTHSSCANESKGEKLSNERLEFLGDSVLSIVVSDFFYKNFSNLPEGELTKLRASFVCEKTLCEFAKQIDLGSYLYLGKGEEINGGRERASILADAFEAIIAAIYLDGGLSSARRFVLKFVKKKLKLKDVKLTDDYKTVLQEIVQQNKEECVSYVLVSESGPAHMKEFCVEVRLNSNVVGKGRGKSKKAAEQNAAKEALALMGR